MNLENNITDLRGPHHWFDMAKATLRDSGIRCYGPGQLMDAYEAYLNDTHPYARIPHDTGTATYRAGTALRFLCPQTFQRNFDKWREERLELGILAKFSVSDRTFLYLDQGDSYEAEKLLKSKGLL